MNEKWQAHIEALLFVAQAVILIILVAFAVCMCFL